MEEQKLKQLYSDGHEYYLAGECSKAIESLTKAIEIQPTNTKALNLRGVCLNETSKFEEALADYNSVLKITELDHECLNNKAIALNNLCKYQEAIECSNSSIKIEPNNHNYYLTRAIAFFNSSKLDFAKNDLKKCTSLGGKDPQCYELLSDLHGKSNRNELALVCLDRAINLLNEEDNSDDEDYKIDLLTKRGLILNNLAQFEKAKNGLKETLELNLKNTDAWLNLATAQLNLLEYKEALESLNKVHKLDPKYETLYDLRAKVFNNLGKYQEAIQDLEYLLELNPKSPIFHARSGLCWNNLAKFNKALICINKALELDQNCVMALNNRALICINLGLLKNAKIDLEKAQLLDPKNIITKINLQTLQKNLNKVYSVYPNGVLLNQLILINSKNFKKFLTSISFF